MNGGVGREHPCRVARGGRALAFATTTTRLGRASSPSLGHDNPIFPCPRCHRHSVTAVAKVNSRTWRQANPAHPPCPSPSSGPVGSFYFVSSRFHVSNFVFLPFTSSTSLDLSTPEETLSTYCCTALYHQSPFLPPRLVLFAIPINLLQLSKATTIID